jgi:hypothetical protein
LSALLLACSGTDPVLIAGIDGGEEGGACPSEGTGTLTIEIAGLPAGVDAKVAAVGPGGDTQSVASTRTLEVPAGSYTLTADKVTTPDPIVRKAFAANGAQVCVRAGQEAVSTITYGLIASSNKVWLDNRSGGSAPLLGYGTDVLGASGEVTANVTAQTRGAGHAAFDRDGNLWVAGNTTVDAPILRYPANVLGGSGTKTHDIELTTDILDKGAPRVTALAFDANGNLWAGIGYAKKVVKFAAEQIRTSGAPTPTVEIDNVEGPQAIAFDDAGNLWTTSDGNVVMYAASRLTASTADPPDLSLGAQSPAPVIGPLPGALGLAFDTAKNLWVNYDGVLVRLTPEDRSGSGDKTITPSIQIKLSVTALANGLAFDESGGLWMAYERGQFIKFSAAQLTSGGDKTPNLVFDSPDLAAGGDVTIYPAPAGSPLYSRLP